MQMKHTGPASSRHSKGYTVGRANFAKISAIEGIRLTDEMERDLDAFERQKLTTTERHGVIGKKYGKAR
jgi:hypothetical protein